MMAITSVNRNHKTGLREVPKSKSLADRIAEKHMINGHDMPFITNKIKYYGGKISELSLETRNKINTMQYIALKHNLLNIEPVENKDVALLFSFMMDSGKHKNSKFGQRFFEDFIIKNDSSIYALPPDKAIKKAKDKIETMINQGFLTTNKSSLLYSSAPKSLRSTCTCKMTAYAVMSVLTEEQRQQIRNSVFFHIKGVANKKEQNEKKH